VAKRESPSALPNRGEAAKGDVYEFSRIHYNLILEKDFRSIISYSRHEKRNGKKMISMKERSLKEKKTKRTSNS